MILQSSFTILVLVISFADAASLPELDKTPWKPIAKPGARNSTKTKANRRQHNPSSYTQVYQLVSRPVTHAAPMTHGSSSRAVPHTTIQQYRPVSHSPHSYSNYGGERLKSVSSHAVPSYAAPVQPQQYQLVPVTMTATTPASPAPSAAPAQTYTYQLIAQSSLPSTTPTPAEPQYQLVLQTSPAGASHSRSYAPSSQGIQLQVIHPSSMDTTLSSAAQSSTTTAPPTSPALVTSVPVVAELAANGDNATFVDVVTVLSKYFRATGTQLTEMFQQLNENSEMNSWGWSTPTTTTTTPAPILTPAPPPPPPQYQSPVVVMPILMPGAQAPALPSYSMPPPPPPQTYQQMPPPQSIQQQAAFSHVQPTYSQPPPMFTMSAPNYQQPPPMISNSPPMYFHPQPPPQQMFSQHPPIMSNLPPPAQPMYPQPTPTYTQPQPMHSQPPPMYFQPVPQLHSHYHSSQIQPQTTSSPPTVIQPPNSPEGKHANLPNIDILDNSIDHEYYYDCDK